MKLGRDVHESAAPDGRFGVMGVPHSCAGQDPNLN